MISDKKIFLLVLPQLLFLAVLIFFNARGFFWLGRGSFKGLLADFSQVPALSAPDPEPRITMVEIGDRIELKMNTAADEVFFYAKGGMLPADLYLGKGTPEGGEWKYDFDTRAGLLPNGNYRVYAQITNEGGIPAARRLSSISTTRFRFPAPPGEPRLRKL